MSEDTILYVNGVMQRCDCGCNVFRKISQTPTENQYQCNGCPAIYSGAPQPPAQDHYNLQRIETDEH